MEVVKNWKPELKRLGFVWTRGAFEFLDTRSKSVQLMISIQKNLHADTYKINPSIMFTNPFVGAGEPELFLLANLRRDGIYLHVTSASWWTVADLDLALAALKEYILPWFQEWGRPGKLVEVLETAIREEKTVLDAAESLPEESTPAPWHHGIAAKIRITPVHFYQAAVLHYLNGDIAKAISRTRDWIASLGANESIDLGKAHTQLSILQQIGNKSLQ
jgi:hypothetical protein